MTPAPVSASLSVLSVCSGIGGLDLGLERAGMRVVGQIERDPYCRHVLAHHFPEVPIHDDARTAPTWWAAHPRPAVDLVAGGPPCQPFSTAGLRRGLDDQRWGWPWMLDLVRLVRPRYVLVENVASLLTDRTGAFGVILADLARLGFDAEWSVLPACALGAPHPRRRLLLVAYPHRGDGTTRLGTRQARPVPGLHRRAGAWRDRVDRALATAGRDGRNTDRLAPRMVAAAGNAVVPDITEHLGHLITAHATATTSAAQEIHAGRAAGFDTLHRHATRPAA